MSKYEDKTDEEIINHISQGIGPAHTAAAQSELMRRWLTKLSKATSDVDKAANKVSESVEELHKDIVSFNEVSKKASGKIVVLTVVLAILAFIQLLFTGVLFLR